MVLLEDEVLSFNDAGSYLTEQNTENIDLLLGVQVNKQKHKRIEEMKKTNNSLIYIVGMAKVCLFWRFEWIYSNVQHQRIAFYGC